MDEHITKRARLSMDEVLMELDNDDQPMTVGSDDEFEDITYLEKERDEYGAIIAEEENPSFSLDSPQFSPPHSPVTVVPHTSTVFPHSPVTSVPGGPTDPSHPPVTSVPGGPTQLSHLVGNAGHIDPYSLPLSSFFSLPLSTLLNLVQSALHSQPTHVAVPSPAPVTTPNPVRPTSAAPRSTYLQTPAPRQSQPARSTTTTTTPGRWSNTLSPVDITPFVQSVGPTVDIPTSKLEVFSLFFTEDICCFITEQSNLYAKQILGEKYAEWK